MAGRRGGRAGKIAALFRLIDRHTAAIEYDWRTRFGLPLRAVFAGQISWREAVSLTSELLADPASHLAASMRGWDYPLSRESLILSDSYDAFVQANTDRRKRSSVKPYPRPFKATDRTQSRRPTVGQTEIRAALAARGHGREVA